MPAPKAPLSRLRALVVDEARFMRALVADLLRQIGVSDVKTAGDGHAAIAAIKHWGPQVVFTELDLPGLSGVELLKWIRTDADSPDPTMPVILIAAATRREQVLRARDTGATEFLAKPITIARVEARLLAALARQRKFIQAESYVGPCRRRRRSSYVGPMRRIEDPAEVDPGAANPTALALLEADVVGLAALARRIDVTERRQLSEIHARAAQAAELAEEASDNPMKVAAGGLVAYLDAVGAGGEVDRDIVLAHISAMSRLAVMGGASQQKRRAIASELGEYMASAAPGRGV